MARLLVDGYNVIRRDPVLRRLELSDPEASRAELVRLLGHHALQSFEVVVVFDGTAPMDATRSSKFVQIRYTHPRTADAVIIAMCRPSDVVVTDDRELASATLSAGPKVWGVTKLLDKVRPVGRTGPASAGSRDKPAELPTAPLRRFKACASCMFSTRDDWIMLCEEDSALGTAKNFRTSW